MSVLDTHRHVRAGGVKRNGGVALADLVEAPEPDTPTPELADVPASEREELLGRLSPDDRERRATRVMHDHGILIPHRTLRVHRAVGVGLPTLCAMLEAETGGGRNIYGHDGVSTCGNYSKGGHVTQDNYRAYKRHRRGCGNQGVGPTQLTWPGYQDQADSAGGCWRPYFNLLVGARILKRLKVGRSYVGMYAAYNGAWTYGVRVAARRLVWARRFRAAGV